MSIFARHARIVVAIAVVLGSTSGIIGKLITATPMAIGFYRLAMALPFFALPILIKHRDTLKKVALRDVGWSLLSGFFLFGHFFSWFSAVQSTEIASAVVLAALHPIVVLFVTIILFKRKVHFRAIIGVIVAISGGALVAGVDFSSGGENFFGDFMAIMAAVFMGVYFSVGNVMRQRIPAGTYIFMVFTGCFVCFGIGMIVTNTPFVGYPITDWILLVVMALICQIGSHAVLNWGLGHVSGLYVSTWETFEIVSAMIFAFLVFGEIPSAWQCAGAIIVITGLLYYNRHEE